MLHTGIPSFYNMCTLHSTRSQYIAGDKKCQQKVFSITRCVLDNMCIYFNKYVCNESFSIVHERSNMCIISKNMSKLHKRAILISRTQIGKISSNEGSNSSGNKFAVTASFCQDKYGLNVAKKQPSVDELRCIVCLRTSRCIHDHLPHGKTEERMMGLCI